MSLTSHAALADLAGRSYYTPWSGTLPIDDVSYDLLPRDSEVIVALPGTHVDDLLQWLRDLATWPPIAFPRVGLCHPGFGEGGTAIAERVLKAVRGEKRLLSVIGHSLGGAMALVVGARLIDAGFRVRVITYGAPRVAFVLNLALSRRLAGALDLVEYRRAGDPVPTVPFWPLFRHVTRGAAIGVDCAPASPIADVIAKSGNHAIGLYGADLRALGR